MIDQSHINYLSLIPTRMKRAATTNGGEYHGPCPFCGGKDRFSINPTPTQGNPMAYCRKCGFAGDPVGFVMRRDNVTFIEAAQTLGLRLENTPPREQKPLCFQPHWQERAQAFIDYAQDHLESCDGAMEYLFNRGISWAVMGAAGLGWNPQDVWDDWAGARVWLPRGIVIPWEIDNQWWRIRFRRLDEDYQSVNHAGDREMKYPQVKGSANGLYFCGRSERINQQHTVVMVEGEFDALVLYSQAARLLRYGLRPVATGGTTQARLIRWQTCLSAARCVLLGFDRDEAGANASVYWRGVLRRARRLQPWDHDITDMWAAGYNLYEWLGVKS